AVRLEVRGPRERLREVRHDDRPEAGDADRQAGPAPGAEYTRLREALDRRAGARGRREGVCLGGGGEGPGADQRSGPGAGEQADDAVRDSDEVRQEPAQDERGLGNSHEDESLDHTLSV